MILSLLQQLQHLLSTALHNLLVLVGLVDKGFLLVLLQCQYLLASLLQFPILQVTTYPDF